MGVRLCVFAVQSQNYVKFRAASRALISSVRLLTDEPRVPPIVLDGQIEKVLLETLNRVRLGLDRQSALDFRLVTVAH